MLKFEYAGTVIECDDPSQVRDLLNVKAAKASTNGAPEPTTAKPPRAKKRRGKARGKKQVTDELWTTWENVLPTEKGTFDFARVRKIAKRISWEGDLRALRSMLIRKQREAAK